MRFDKRALVFGAAAVALTVVLGELAGELAGVLTALSGAAFVVLWQIASDRQAKVKVSGDRLSDAEIRMTPPRTALNNP